MKHEAMEILSVTKLGQRVEKYFRDSILKPSNECNEKFIKDFNQNPRHALEWNVEQIIVWQEVERLWARLAVTVRKAENEGQAKDFIMDQVREVAKHCLRFPPRHNSTGEVSNLSSQCENQARSDFVQKASEIAGDFTFVA
jgi:hypothetical protein